MMRGMSKNFADQGFHDYQTYKWVVLDGDIDAVWIKSMNVMDDNKVLTLVPYERVPEGLCFDYFYAPKSGEQVQWLSQYLRPAQGKENVIFHG